VRKTAAVDLEKNHFYRVVGVCSVSRPRISLHHGQQKRRTKHSCRFWLPLTAELGKRRNGGLRSIKGSNGPKPVPVRSSCGDQSCIRDEFDLVSLRRHVSSGEVLWAGCWPRSPPPADQMQMQAAGARPVPSGLSKDYLCLSEKHFLLVTTQWL